MLLVITLVHRLGEEPAGPGRCPDLAEQRDQRHAGPFAVLVSLIELLRRDLGSWASSRYATAAIAEHSRKRTSERPGNPFRSASVNTVGRSTMPWTATSSAPDRSRAHPHGNVRMRSAGVMIRSDPARVSGLLCRAHSDGPFERPIERHRVPARALDLVVSAGRVARAASPGHCPASGPAAAPIKPAVREERLGGETKRCR